MKTLQPQHSRRAAALRSLSLLCLMLLSLLTGCAGTPNTEPHQKELSKQADYPPTVFSAQRILPHDYDFMAIYDPWQGMNQRIYNFNYQFDHWVFLPVVNTWEKIVPGFIRAGVHNVFKTLNDVNTMVNSALQLRPDKLVQSTGRVAVNSTLGLFGLVDVASRMGIPRPEEDFGQTLGRWGVARGPYVVLPFLGPSNLRDSVGLIPDFAVDSAVRSYLIPDDLSLPTSALRAVDTRAHTDFRYYETGFIYEYRMLRWLYSTKRDLDVIK